MFFYDFEKLTASVRSVKNRTTKDVCCTIKSNIKFASNGKQWRDGIVFKCWPDAAVRFAFASYSCRRPILAVAGCEHICRRSWCFASLSTERVCLAFFFAF
ncbi:hypothetical protein Tsp_05462 [Trichinella spiralis]|uniref:hypothetical protein n=1 Tax=Trichinella spiralis TaxID=6334 RepID=UPI0001EFD986|nr:hypothetical protein Tsp_05462 [Trichinella spiralis]